MKFEQISVDLLAPFNSTLRGQKFLLYLLLTIINLNGGLSQNLCGGTGRFQCEDGTCISRAYICDGVKHCRNGYDERRCAGRHICNRIEQMARDNHYECRKPCRSDSDCRSRMKRCVCDHECGKSCLNSEKICQEEPPTVEHADVVVKRVLGRKLRPVDTSASYKYADLAIYTCERGYKLVGPTPRCTAKGVWSDEVPTCQDLTCREQVPLINNSNDYWILRTRRGNTKSYHHTYAILMKGDKLQYVCDDGYDLEGEPPVCSEHLQLTNSSARCVVQCYHQRNPSLISEYGLQCGKECFASSDCQEREECVCVGPCSRVCANSSASCPPPPIVYNSRISSEGSGLGQIARYQCNPGYYLASGKLSLHCSSLGTWLGETPRCMPIMCGSPYRSIEETGGYAMGDGLFYGDRVTFACDGNRQLIGSKTRECQENGLWNGSLAVCIDPDDNSRCPHPGVPINGRLLTTNFDIGATVRFECKEGYLMYGLEEQQCTDFRRWSGLGAPVCKYYQYPAGEKESADVFTTALSQMPERKSSFSRTIDINDYYEKHEIFFIIDISRSITSFDLADEIGFAIALVNRMKSFRKSLKYAIMTFGTDPHTLLSLNDNDRNSNEEEVIRRLRSILQRGTKGGTATKKALDDLQNQIALARAQGVSKDTKTHVFVFTDGMHSTGDDPVPTRKDIENEFAPSVEFYSITACDRCSKEALDEVKGLASKDSNYIRINDYYQLEKYLKKVTNIKIDYSKCGSAGDVGTVLGKTSFGRTFGGSKANVTAWPWQAAIVRHANNSNSLREVLNSIEGGGSIINNKWILTAAHVLLPYEHFSPKVLLVFLGRFPQNHGNRSRSVDSLPLQGFEIDRYFLHPDFSNVTYNNDIALIKIGHPVNKQLSPDSSKQGEIEFNFHVRPICLPCTGTCLTEKIMTSSKEDNAALERCIREERVLRKAGEKSVATGFGEHALSSGSDDRLEMLRQVLLEIGEDAICETDVKKVNKHVIYNENNICAEAKLDGRRVDTCKGDSGGPMIREMYDRDSKQRCWVQIGIVSFGVQECGGGYGKIPGYYTNVMRYIPWINETIGYTLSSPTD